MIASIISWQIEFIITCGNGCGEDYTNCRNSVCSTILSIVFLVPPLLASVVLWGPWLVYMRCKNMAYVRQIRAEADAASTRGFERQNNQARFEEVSADAQEIV